MEFESKDISTITDVKILVDDFYNRIRANELLAPIFNGIIGEHWEKHLQRMYDFWQTILLETPVYNGSPFLKHEKLPISKAHFDVWIELWNQTIEDHFKGEKADEAKWRAARMSEMFQYKLAYYKNNSAQPLI